MAVGDDNSTATDRSWFRGDIDGLRAIAIVLVVAFHAGVRGFSGGFIGVDVFFVISGYLITRNLVSEVDRSGRIRLARFWANRAKRLVPAMALMVVVTFLLSALVLSPIESSFLPVQGASAVVYVSNIVFARANNGYFNEAELVSPFLHTWSLSVEEQFYLLWPVMIALTALALRAKRLPRRGLIIILVLGSIVSMALNLIATNADSPWAFYSLPTRAWEFGLAGLLAIVVIPERLRRRNLQIVAAVVGAALLVYGTVSLDDIGYPGWQATVPVAATLLVLFAGMPFGHAPLPSTTVLSTAPMQWVGRVSYSWYLWHWPFMILAVAWLDSATVAVRLGAGLVALPVAAALYTWFEKPIRFSPRLVGSSRLALGMAACVSVVALISAVAFSRFETAARTTEPTATLLRVKSNYSKNRCATNLVSPSGIPYCVEGDIDGDRTLMLIGDSHARHWEQAFAEQAAAHGIRLVARWMGACPSIDIRTTAKMTFPDGKCTQYRAQTLALIDELQVDAVVVSNSYLYLNEITSPSGGPVDDDEAVAEWHDAFVEHIEAIRRIRPVVVGRISDSPDMVIDPLACISRPGNGEGDCRVPRDEALSSGARFADAEDRAAAELGGLPTLETIDTMCDASWCDPERNGVYVFVDPHHLTKEWTAAQGDRIDALYAELGLL